MQMATAYETALHAPECKAGNALRSGGGPGQSLTPPGTLGSLQVPTTQTAWWRAYLCRKTYGHTWGISGHAYLCKVKNWAILQNPQVPKCTSVWNNQAAEVTCFSWHFLGSCKESEAGSWGALKIQRFMLRSFAAWMGGEADGTAELLSLLAGTLCSCSASKGRRKILGSSSSFLETSKVMPVFEYKASVFLKVGSCPVKCSFLGFNKMPPPPPQPRPAPSQWFQLWKPLLKTPRATNCISDSASGLCASVQLFPHKVLLRPKNRLVPLKKQYTRSYPPQIYTTTHLKVQKHTVVTIKANNSINKWK